MLCINIGQLYNQEIILIFFHKNLLGIIDLILKYKFL